MTSTTLAEGEKAIASVKGYSLMDDLSWPLAVIFLFWGIISDAMNITLGLEALHWFLLGIAGLLGAVFLSNALLRGCLPFGYDVAIGEDRGVRATGGGFV